LLAHFHRYLIASDPGQESVALKHARRAIAVGDQPSEARVTIGILTAQQGNWDAAMREFSQAMQLDPNNPEAARWAAKVYARRGDVDNEARMARAAAEAAPGDALYATGVQHVLVEKVGDYRQALEIHQRALEKQPNDPVRWHYVGDVYRHLGDDARAADAYRRAISLAPDEYASVNGLGVAYYRMGRRNEALELFQRGATLAPASPESHRNVGVAYLSLRRYPEAGAAYERSFALKAPETAEQLVGLCEVYVHTSAFDRAERCLKTTLAMDPRHARAQRLLSDVNARSPR
jgi:tetratricopeptide (TPR) repeat protein